MTAAELVGWVERSRRDQGFGPVIDDLAILARIATLAFAGSGPEGRDPPRNRPPEGGRRAQNPAKEPSIENPMRTAQTGQEGTRVRRGGGGRGRR